ncbi:MAG: hypothetical protein JWO02_2468, partial [Solirubrobacterales bacterium]|nr:hypothetical protein [Solirubrobacterales bacterium]
MRAPAVAAAGRSGSLALGTARAGVVMAIATFAMAGASALQAVIYLSRFGTDGRTDGFFVAFALYTTFGVFGQSVRLTAVPLLVEPDPRMTARDFARALALIALPVLLATVVFAGPLARLLAPGLTAADRSVTAAALPLLGGAMALQLWASGGATVLAIRGQFGTVAAAYIAGAVSGLVVFLSLISTAGELTLGWSMLAMAVVTCGWMLAGVLGGRSTGTTRPGVRPGHVVRDAGELLGRTVIYLAVNVLFVITLASASRSTAGDATVLSYAYLFASYLVAGTGMALGMSRIPDMTRAARTEQRALVAATVPQGFRYAILIVAPALGLLVAAGAPLIHDALPASLDAHGVATLQAFTALLAPWTVAALLVSFLLPALLATGRAGLLNALALPLLVVHVLATLAGHALLGVWGSVAGLWVAPAGFAVILLLTGAGAQSGAFARRVAADALRFMALAGAA